MQLISLCGQKALLILHPRIRQIPPTLPIQCRLGTALSQEGTDSSWHMLIKCFSFIPSTHFSPLALITRDSNEIFNFLFPLSICPVFYSLTSFIEHLFGAWQGARSWAQGFTEVTEADITPALKETRIGKNCRGNRGAVLDRRRGGTTQQSKKRRLFWGSDISGDTPRPGCSSPVHLHTQVSREASLTAELRTCLTNVWRSDQCENALHAIKVVHKCQSLSFVFAVGRSIFTEVDHREKHSLRANAHLDRAGLLLHRSERKLSRIGLSPEPSKGKPSYPDLCLSPFPPTKARVHYILMKILMKWLSMDIGGWGIYVIKIKYPISPMGGNGN